MATPEIELPHPRATARRFVLEPLAEIRPDLKLPGQKKNVKALLAKLPGSGAGGASSRRMVASTPMKELREKKERGERITALTAYDYPTARLLDESGLDIILVGDSLGMVVLGYEDTTRVTLERNDSSHASGRARREAGASRRRSADLYL